MKAPDSIIRFLYAAVVNASESRHEGIADGRNAAIGQSHQGELITCRK